MRPVHQTFLVLYVQLKENMQEGTNQETNRIITATLHVSFHLFDECFLIHLHIIVTISSPDFQFSSVMFVYSSVRYTLTPAS